MLVLGKEERELGLLEGDGEGGADDIGPHVIGVVLGHESRGHIDAQHRSRRGIDILDQGGKAPGQGFVESRTEETVDHHRTRREQRRVELLGDLNQVHRLLQLKQAFLVGCTFGRQPLRDIEQVDGNVATRLGKEPRHRQCIPAIVARSGKNDHGCMAVPTAEKFGDDSLGCTLHQIDRFDGFMSDGILV